MNGGMLLNFYVPGELIIDIQTVVVQQLLYIQYNSGSSIIVLQVAL